MKLFLLSLLLASTFAAAKQDDCEENFRRIEALLKKNFDTGVDPKYPEKLEISLRRKDGKRYLESAKRLWTKYWPDEDLIAELKEAEKAGNVPAETLKKLKSARARLKTIRFLCEAICDDHEAPKRLDEITKIIGKVEEVQTFGGQPNEVSKAIKKAFDALDKKSMGKLTEELDNLRAADREGNEKWLKAAFKLIEKSLDQKALTKTELHDVRKTLGRVQAMVLFDTIDKQDQERLAAYTWIKSVYNKMGIEHDALVKLEYEHKDFDDAVLSKEVREELENFLKAAK